MPNIKTKRITAENFSTFGSVVTSPKGVPTSESPAYRFWSDIAHYYVDGETEVGLCTVYRQSEMSISGLERHLRTPEILIPIDGPFVLPLVPEAKPEDAMEAFTVHPGEAVVIKEGIWHGACLPLGRKESSYFVIFKRNTPHEDVEKKTVQTMHILL